MRAGNAYLCEGTCLRTSMKACVYDTTAHPSWLLYSPSLVVNQCREIELVSGGQGELVESTNYRGSRIAQTRIQPSRLRQSRGYILSRTRIGKTEGPILVLLYHTVRSTESNRLGHVAVIAAQRIGSTNNRSTNLSCLVPRRPLSTPPEPTVRRVIVNSV